MLLLELAERAGVHGHGELARLVLAGVALFKFNRALGCGNFVDGGIVAGAVGGLGPPLLRHVPGQGLVVHPVIGHLEILRRVLAHVHQAHHALGLGHLFLLGEVHAVLALKVLLERHPHRHPELVAGALALADGVVAAYILGVLSDLVLGAGELHVPAPAFHLSGGGLAQHDGVVVKAHLHGHIRLGDANAETAQGVAGGKAQHHDQGQGQQGDALDRFHMILSLLVFVLGPGKVRTHSFIGYRTEKIRSKHPEKGEKRKFEKILRNN